VSTPWHRFYTQTIYSAPSRICPTRIGCLFNSIGLCFALRIHSAAYRMSKWIYSDIKQQDTHRIRPVIDPFYCHIYFFHHFNSFYLEIQFVRKSELNDEDAMRKSLKLSPTTNYIAFVLLHSSRGLLLKKHACDDVFWLGTYIFDDERGGELFLKKIF
jgi:hypothetical protein